MVAGVVVGLARFVEEEAGEGEGEGEGGSPQPLPLLNALEGVGMALLLLLSDDLVVFSTIAAVGLGL